MKEKSWDVAAQEYDKIAKETGDENHEKFLNPKIFKLLKNVKNKKILDLGCGNGYFSRNLYSKGAIVTGIDYSKKLIKIAKQKSNKKIKYYAKNSANLKGLKKEEFDFIISNIVLMDVKDYKNTIKEVTRVLKKQGTFIFSITHPFTDDKERKKDEKGYYLKQRKYTSSYEFEHPFLGEKGIIVYHRSIQELLRPLFENNFLINDFQEININLRDRKKITDEKLLENKKEFPTFLIISAKKF